MGRWDNPTGPTTSVFFPNAEGSRLTVGGLGAGGVFTRCFGLRPRDCPMAGPLEDAPEGGPGGERGDSGSRICLVFTGLIKVCQILDW